MYHPVQKLSVTERRGARASFKLSRKLPFIKKTSLTLSGENDESKGKKIVVVFRK